MISAPSAEDHATILADWLELLAFRSSDARVAIRSLKDLKDITQDSEAEDIADFDAACDALQGRVTSELLDRSNFLGAAYPFAIDDSGAILTVRTLEGVGVSSYLCCLLMSHIVSSPLLAEIDFAESVPAGREMFQICATLSAAGWCEGVGISFGWPRLDRANFSTKLADVYRLFGDGTPRVEPLPAAPPHIKDGGIDVIAWRPTRDRLPGTLYLLGQVASGRNWKDKSVVNDIRSFHWAWFEVAPASEATAAMFVPFCVTENQEEIAGEINQEFIVNKMQFLVREFGQFFYRYRLPYFAEQVTRLVAAGVEPIEGLAELHRVETWIGQVRDRLTRAAAA